MEPRVSSLLIAHAKDRDLTEEENLIGLDWSHADFSGFNLSHCVLSTPDKTAVFTKAKLSEANLFQAQLENALIDRADLQGANLEGVNLSRAHIEKCYLRGASLKEANLGGTHLKDLEGSRADFSGASFHTSQLSHCHFEKTRFDDTDLTHSEIKNCYFKQCHFEHANLAHSRSEKSHFSKCRMKYLKLTGAQVKECNFERTDFKGAIMIQVDFYKSNFTDANLQGSVLNHSELLDCSLEGADLRNSKVRETDFTRARLYQTVLTGANMEFAKLEKIWTYEEGEEFPKSMDLYRNLKNTFRQNGAHGRASNYSYLESVMQRRLYRKEGLIGMWVLYVLADAVCGFGERSEKIMSFALGIILAYAVVFHIGEGVIDHTADSADQELLFREHIYFSIATFTTLGYGDYSPKEGPFQILAVSEALLGLILMALLVVTLMRKIVT